MSKTNIEKARAKRWGCNVRTIRRWLKAGAPLNDPKRMRVWLAGQQSLPPGTARLLASLRTTESAKADTQPQTLAMGVAPALRRLEEMEARAFSDLRRAQATGDPIAVKQAHAIWLRNGEALRKHDLAIEQSRRDAGELVPRETIERLAFELQEALAQAHFALQDCCLSLTGLGSPIQVWEVLQKTGHAMRAGVIAFLQRPRSPKHPIPAWLAKAATLGQFPTDTEQASEYYGQLWSALSVYMKGATEKARADLDRKLAEDKARRLKGGAA